mgnify:CR=1 FL=1
MLFRSNGDVARALAPVVGVAALVGGLFVLRALAGRERGATDEEVGHPQNPLRLLAAIAERFAADQKPLRFPKNDADLRCRFTVHHKRRVSSDHVVSIDSALYEMPRGTAGASVVIKRNVLDDRLTFDHRVTDGAPAAAFLRRVREILESPYILLT